MEHSRQFVESLARGFALLDIVCKSKQPLTLSELSKQSQLSVSTIQRLSYTLHSLGLIDRDATTKKFRVGPQMMSLAFQVVENLELKKIAYPIMARLSDEINEVVGLGALSGNDIILIEIILKTRQILNININPGNNLPLHATASGKVILAYLPESEADRILENANLTELTQKTITSVNSFKNQLKQVKASGYATAIDEGSYGLSTIAVPVRNNLGEVVAALTIMIPTARARGHASITAYKERLVQVALELSQALGYQGAIT